jgi:FkbM family methyltransferase
MQGFTATLKRGPMLKVYKRAALQKRIIMDWAATHIFKGSRAVNTPYGFRLMASNYVGNLWMKDGKFEQEEMAIATRVLREVDVFVDVGANIGYYTCLAGVAKKQVLAFEPFARNLWNLYESIRLNQFTNIEVFPMALGAEAGITQIFGATGPSASLLRNWASYSSSYKETIPVNTMDAVVTARVQGRKAFVKIDVEGFEYQVLLGAKSLINATPKPIWLIEICLNEYHPGGKNLDYEKTFNLFFDAGYRVFLADSREIEVTREDIKNWAAANKSPHGIFNYLIRE